ncbi:hypothetical protein HMPREF0765_1286 [Sphingobacterium spiritivorum ATCC 33300]|uniref:Response regulatory domain-containing protein n=1 Tax=Sphingobacterium spiritivorum ATCC 33300 TaxID=525372 RepID=C2FVD0_SPHSI|nr:hypothetical protein HMPREF0765_1286 [Sphingobacterium spiritivorum ATCC 33300]
MILIVDDKSENIYSLKRLLESKDFLVRYSTIRRRSSKKSIKK